MKKPAIELVAFGLAIAVILAVTILPHDDADPVRQIASAIGILE